MDKNLTRTWRWVAELIAVLGAVGAIALWPRASMFSGATLDPSDPFATPFGFTNEGYQALRNISFACAVNSLDTLRMKSAFTMKHAGISARTCTGRRLTQMRLRKFSAQSVKDNLFVCLRPVQAPKALTSISMRRSRSTTYLGGFLDAFGSSPDLIPRGICDGSEEASGSNAVSPKVSLRALVQEKDSLPSKFQSCPTLNDLRPA